jgi:hypothetical protein
MQLVDWARIHVESAGTGRSVVDYGAPSANLILQASELVRG